MSVKTVIALLGTACMAGGRAHTWQGGMCGRGAGVCGVGTMRGRRDGHYSGRPAFLLVPLLFFLSSFYSCNLSMKKRNRNQKLLSTSTICMSITDAANILNSIQHKKKLTNNSSTVVLHFSKLIRLIAHISFRGLHQADCTTAVAPAPTSNKNAVVDEHLHLMPPTLRIKMKNKNAFQ